MDQHIYSTFVLNILLISTVTLTFGSFKVDYQNSSSSRSARSKWYLDSEYAEIGVEWKQFLDNGTGKPRVKRQLPTESHFFLRETELGIRDGIVRLVPPIDLDLLPKFGGKDATPPYANLIQVLSHTRSYRDGPLDGDFALSTADMISVSVDPMLHRFTKGKWTMYAGARHQRCATQLIYGNGYKATFDCYSEGTYYAFFRAEGTYQDENDVVDGVKFKETDYISLDYVDPNFADYSIDTFIPFSDYENLILQDPDSVTKPWYYSDPIKMFKNAYCYRWNYRLFKGNEVGFVHLEPNPEAIAGAYIEYTLKVWIIDPSEVLEEELNSPAYLLPSIYSQELTRRFFLGGLVPCLRFAHSVIEITSDAEYVQSDLRGKKGVFDSVSLQGPHWRFKFRVHLDRIVSTLSDIQFTITPRQHTALYDCFIANVRVYIPAKTYVFLPAAKVSATAINLEYSSISQVLRRFLKENVINYYGHEVVYVGPTYLKELNDSAVKVFTDPCINQELSVEWKGTVGMTSDFFSINDVDKVVLPSFDGNRVGLRAANLQLSEAERKAQMEKSNNITYTKDKDLRIKFVDFAYTPVDLIYLTEDSALYLHSTDLALRGIGYNTFTQKYKLGSLVKRRWCARSSTPKIHNMWVPAFSRDSGQVIMIVHVPLEGASVITQHDDNASCEEAHDPNAAAKGAERALSEKEIHADEEDDARIDRVVEAKLRTKSAELRIQTRDKNRRVIRRKTRNDIPADQKTFWVSGGFVLEEGKDPHYQSGSTDGRKIRIANTGLEKQNANIIFIVDTDFGRIRRNLEENGLSFELDETVYSAGRDVLERPAANYRMLRYHSLEFTGVEKQYLLAVEFQSAEFRKADPYINSIVIVICTFATNDLPFVLEAGLEEEKQLTDVAVGFTGLIIRRLKTVKLGQHSPYDLKDEDYKDNQGREAKPLPMSLYTTILNTINTAIPLYILRLNDVIFFASLDGSFAKPILSYAQEPTPNKPIEAQPFLPFEEFDLVVTEQGILSALSRKKFVSSTPVTANEIFVGCVLDAEPLRYIHPFHVHNNVFQVSTSTGEVIYGKVHYNEATDSFDGPPRTEILNVPFWSLLKGSFARSAGENTVPLGQSAVASGSAASFADPICPFATFNVWYFPFPYVEAGYVTRITAEVAFYGDVIPLEADIIVDFSEVQGVSVVVSSSVQVDHDQTIISKIIELETSLPDPLLREMQNRHRAQTNDDEQTQEQVRVFTITIRPSLLNLHCNKEHYFRTIQINVGCVPLSRMRLLAEALPLKKIDVVTWTEDMERSRRDLPTDTWFYEASAGISYLVLSKQAIHKSQHKSFDCNYPRYCKIPVPAGRRIEENVYGLSFRDALVPKFEQFLTQHARRVTGNVVMYDILDSFKEEETQLETNTTHYTAGCLADDDTWYDKMAKEANFARKELSVNSDIYRYFKNCFNEEGLKPINQIQALNDREYFLFNTSNKNALQLKKKRNYIYVLRATVVNTENNRFTFCQKMDTFFVLQVVNIAQQQKVIENYIKYVYLGTIAFVVFVLFLFYYYFATRMQWTVDLEPKTIYDQQEEDRIVDDLRKRYDAVPMSPYGRLAKRIAELEKIQRNSKQFHISRQREREERLSASKRAKSEGDKRPSQTLSPSTVPDENGPMTEETRKSGDSNPTEKVSDAKEASESHEPEKKTSQ